jgi:hypothetical protein
MIGRSDAATRTASRLWQARWSNATARQIDAAVGVTEGRACQLYSQSIMRLRAKLREWKARGRDPAALRKCL